MQRRAFPWRRSLSLLHSLEHAEPRGSPPDPAWALELAPSRLVAVRYVGPSAPDDAFSPAAKRLISCRPGHARFLPSPAGSRLSLPQNQSEIRTIPGQLNRRDRCRGAGVFSEYFLVRTRAWPDRAHWPTPAAGADWLALLALVPAIVDCRQGAAARRRREMS